MPVRIPDDLRALGERVSTSAICDAMMRLHAHRAHIVGLVSPAPERAILARAVTMRFMPLRADLFAPERHDFLPLVLEAVGDAPQGTVLAVGSGGHPDQPVAGGKKLSRLANLGMAGIVTDARLRDFDEVIDLGIAAWAGGESVRQGGEVIMPWEANVPVEIAGVTVVPGDVIRADRSGAVVIPGSDLRAVLEEAVAIEQLDEQIVARLRADDLARIGVT